MDDVLARLRARVPPDAILLRTGSRGYLRSPDERSDHDVVALVTGCTRVDATQRILGSLSTSGLSVTFVDNRFMPLIRLRIDDNDVDMVVGAVDPVLIASLVLCAPVSRAAIELVDDAPSRRAVLAVLNTQCLREWFSGDASREHEFARLRAWADDFGVSGSVLGYFNGIALACLLRVCGGTRDGVLRRLLDHEHPKPIGGEMAPDGVLCVPTPIEPCMNTCHTFTSTNLRCVQIAAHLALTGQEPMSPVGGYSIVEFSFLRRHDATAKVMHALRRRLLEVRPSIDADMLLLLEPNSRTRACPQSSRRTLMYMGVHLFRGLSTCTQVESARNCSWFVGVLDSLRSELSDAHFEFSLCGRPGLPTPPRSIELNRVCS
jgi:hypothetical protein